MFWTMSIILFVLWALGMTTGSTEGYWVHLLLLFAVVTLILAVSKRSRRVLA
ncbi:lmo0937 family membrane protein [Hyalangium rubrum]|uniref:Lmo0937 family membrane protein n=1 Tax=Hyalangium rubrum TaxID=3103134 RepID=A0ABU5HIG4_9BACT|nr:lmo0937 family membrane protein [Hyalangium sp. s54d21]MDY7233240.1 lmo0937 family membrane protein [Hyalangium sp. s54d21]